jgi:ABC-type long-subunit fatty acid transport system fused permease/ATPase subunit
MSRENLENRAIGSVVVGVVSGAVASYITAGYLTLYALVSGRIKLIEYTPVQPGHWRSWDIWTIAISLAVGVMTTIFVSRSLFKWGEAAVKSKQLG